jgi:hypothetical protein
MSNVNTENVAEEQKIVENKNFEEEQMIEEEQKFWEEKKIKEEHKPEVKKQSTSLCNKFKRKKKVTKTLVIAKCTRGEVLLDTSNVRFNFL